MRKHGLVFRVKAIFVRCSEQGGTAIDLVRDRKVRMKHQLFVAGVTSLEYWLAQFLTFLPIIAIPTVLTFILVFATDLSALTGNAHTYTHPHAYKRCRFGEHALRVCVVM